MSKNKKNNTSKQQKQLQKPVTPEIIKEQAEDVEKLENTLLSVSDSSLEEEELSDYEKKAAEDLMVNHDTAKYLNRLMDIHKMLIAAKNKYEELQKKAKEDATKAEQELKARSEALKANETALEKVKLQLAKDKDEVLRRETAISNQQYTDVTLNLLNGLRETEKQISQATIDRIEELSSAQSKLLSDLIQQFDKEEVLSRRETELSIERQTFDKEKQIFEKSKRLEEGRLELKEQELRQIVADEYLDRLEALEKENKKLGLENTRLKNECNNAHSTLNDLVNLSGGIEAEEILSEYRSTQSELKTALEELNKRPTLEDYQSKDEAVQLLTNRVQSLQQQVHEEEIAKLKEKLSKENYYIQEINQYHSQIDTLQANNDHKDLLIGQLQGVISQLRGEDGKQKKAFEFCTSVDGNDMFKEEIRTPSAVTGMNLKQMVQYLRSYMYSNAGYLYDEQTIRLFIAGLHMSPLSILQGISGTGKTSLPREIAKAFVAGSPKYDGFTDGMPLAPYRICAIQSGWRDRMDLLGYFNHFDKKYQETEFFRALYVASQPKYKNTLFLIVLDEMNLSHPEHYFADFLSLLEQDEKDRYINIDAPAEFLPSVISKNGKMKVPENVRFIGTANHDETTLGFAPKTCDRSNLMQIHRSTNNSIRPVGSKLLFTYEWLDKQFKQAEDRYVPNVKTFSDFLTNSDVEDIFQNLGIGIGKRLESQAKRFISVYMATDPASNSSLAEAADHLIATRLLRNIENKLELKSSIIKDFKDNLNLYFDNYFHSIPKQSNLLLDKAIDRQ